VEYKISTKYRLAFAVHDRSGDVAMQVIDRSAEVLVPFSVSKHYLRKSALHAVSEHGGGSISQRDGATRVLALPLAHADVPESGSGQGFKPHV
jgi:hypothetical protein